MYYCVPTRLTWKVPEYSKTSPVLLTVIKLKTSEVSEFSILTLILKSKPRKIRNFSKICKFQRMCFILECWIFPRFPSFRFWPLYWNQNLGKLAIFPRLVNFKECALFEEVGNLRGFRVIDFGPCTEIEN